MKNRISQSAYQHRLSDQEPLPGRSVHYEKIQHLTQPFQRMRCVRYRLDLMKGDLTGDAEANGGVYDLLFSLKCIMSVRQGRLSIQANGVGGCCRRSNFSVYVLEAD